MNIECEIAKSLILSTEYIEDVQSILQDKPITDFIEGTASKLVASWCMEYFNQYNKSPGKKHIWDIYYDKAESLNRDTAAMIEKDYLPDLGNPSDP